MRRKNIQRHKYLRNYFTTVLKKITPSFEFLGYCVLFSISCFYGVLKVDFAVRGSSERPRIESFPFKPHNKRSGCRFNVALRSSSQLERVRN